MKISELERNYISQNVPDPPRAKGTYKNIVPMVIGDYEVRYKKQHGYTDISVWDKNNGVAELRLQPAQFQGIQGYHVAWA